MRGRIAWLAMNLSLQLLLGSIAVAAGEAPESTVDSQTGPAVLMVSYWPPEGRGYSFHPMAVSRLREHLPGLQVAGVGAGELKPGQERSFHLVVLSYPPAEGDSPLAQRFAKDHERWHSYLRSGGGLLVMADENFYGSHRVLNGFMRRFGAELLPEAVADPQRSLRQDDYFRCWFSLTANISQHPVCLGVRELCYPNGNRQFEGATQAMRLDDTWTVVVRGEASARSMPIQGNPAEASFDRLRDDSGLSGRTPIRAEIHQGAAVGDIYELVVAAASGLLEMTVQGPGLPGGQPVVVQGLNDKWDAGVVDVASQALRRIAVAEGEGRFLAERGSLGRRLRVGNLVSCDEPEARLALFRVQGGWQVVIHNPLDREMNATLSFPVLDELITLHPVVAVGPGSTRVLDLPASK